MTLPLDLNFKVHLSLSPSKASSKCELVLSDLDTCPSFVPWSFFLLHHLIQHGGDWAMQLCNLIMIFCFPQGHRWHDRDGWMVGRWLWAGEPCPNKMWPVQPCFLHPCYTNTHDTVPLIHAGILDAPSFHLLLKTHLFRQVFPWSALVISLFQLILKKPF